MRSTSFWTLRSSRCWGRYCWFVGWFVIPTVCHRPGLPDHLLGRYTGAEQFARNLLCDVGTPVTSLEASTTNNCGRLTTCTMEEADVVEEAITPTIRSMSVIAILGHLSAGPSRWVSFSVLSVCRRSECQHQLQLSPAPPTLLHWPGDHPCRVRPL